MSQHPNDIRWPVVKHYSVADELRWLGALDNPLEGLCVECNLPVSEVTHGTPPTYSDHHYVTTGEATA